MRSACGAADALGPNRALADAIRAYRDAVHEGGVRYLDVLSAKRALEKELSIAKDEKERLRRRLKERGHAKSSLKASDKQAEKSKADRKPGSLARLRKRVEHALTGRLVDASPKNELTISAAPLVEAMEAPRRAGDLSNEALSFVATVLDVYPLLPVAALFQVLVAFMLVPRLHTLYTFFTYWAAAEFVRRCFEAPMSDVLGVTLNDSYSQHTLVLMLQAFILLMSHPSGGLSAALYVVLIAGNHLLRASYYLEISPDRTQGVSY